MSLFNKKRNVRQSSGRGKKVLIVAGLMLGFMCLAPAMNSQAVDSVMGIETVYAATQQTDRWEAVGGDVWKLKTTDKSGYVSNAWFQDLDGSWYMIGADGSMLSGLITDQSTGKSYLMNVQHDGTFGKMLTVDGVYNLNGQQVYLTFNQQHDGSYGAILSGLSEARSAGIAEKQLGSIPTDSASADLGSSVNSQLEKDKVSEEKINNQIENQQKNTGWKDTGNGGIELGEDTIGGYDPVDPVRGKNYRVN